MGAVREPVYEWCTGLHGSMRGGADKCTKRTARVHGPEVWLIGMVVGFLHAEVGMQVHTHVLFYYVWEAYRAASMQCVLAGLCCLIIHVRPMLTSVTEGSLDGAGQRWGPRGGGQPVYGSGLL